jgi:predicted MFS family arabinose efflux permease
MIAILAHHMEPQQIPVVLAIFAAGIWIGNRLVGKLTEKKR